MHNSHQRYTCHFKVSCKPPVRLACERLRWKKLEKRRRCWCCLFENNNFARKICRKEWKVASDSDFRFLLRVYSILVDGFLIIRLFRRHFTAFYLEFGFYFRNTTTRNDNYLIEKTRKRIKYRVAISFFSIYFFLVRFFWKCVRTRKLTISKITFFFFIVKRKWDIKWKYERWRERREGRMLLVTKIEGKVFEIICHFAVTDFFFFFVSLVACLVSIRLPQHGYCLEELFYFGSAPLSWFGLRNRCDGFILSRWSIVTEMLFLDWFFFSSFLFACT